MSAAWGWEEAADAGWLPVPCCNACDDGCVKDAPEYHTWTPTGTPDGAPEQQATAAVSNADVHALLSVVGELGLLPVPGDPPPAAARREGPSVSLPENGAGGHGRVRRVARAATPPPPKQTRPPRLMAPARSRPVAPELRWKRAGPFDQAEADEQIARARDAVDVAVRNDAIVAAKRAGASLREIAAGTGVSVWWCGAICRRQRVEPSPESMARLEEALGQLADAATRTMPFYGPHDERDAAIIAARRAGATFNQIAAASGISAERCRQVSREAGF